MPSGLECDQYSVMGEITEMNTTKNAVTGERVYELGLVCNDVPIDICIKRKGFIWSTGSGKTFQRPDLAAGNAGTSVREK